MVGPSWSVVAFAPVRGDVLESPRAVSVVGFAFEVVVEPGVAAAAVVPRSVFEVGLEWMPATEHVAIERDAAAGLEVVPWIESG